MFIRLCAAVACATLASANASVAQAITQRIIGPNANGEPLETRGVSPNSISQLAAAAGVPMGLETAPREQGRSAAPAHETVRLTGQTLYAGLDALMALDPRYEWRDLDGVIVIRPIAAWYDIQNPLNAPVSGVKLEDVRCGRAALELAAKSLGRTDSRNYLSDSKRCTIEMPQGTVFDVLNAAVRAHGELTWAVEWTPFDHQDLAAMVWMFVAGAGGYGEGITK